MRVGEIWEYKGQFQPAKDGKRWSDDPDCGWYMDKVRLIDLHFDCGESGRGIAFEAAEGEPHPMEAFWALPKEMFLQAYTKEYE
jgi:hypothetical protein